MAVVEFDLAGDWTSVKHLEVVMPGVGNQMRCIGSEHAGYGVVDQAIGIERCSKIVVVEAYSEAKLLKGVL